MSVKGEIPEDILRFLTSPGGHSLIVKGHAGTGKTTFALQLSEDLEKAQKSYYISTRVSDSSLYDQFPWLRDKMKVEVRENEPPKKVDRTELTKLEGRIESGEEGDQTDETYDKMGEGQVVERSIVFDLGSDLPEIDAAYESVEKYLPNKTLVLIDSIDALSQRYGVAASKLINTLQKDLVENSKVNVVYVLESGRESHLDYLGDGVVLFESLEHRGRRLRVMTIEKLRGTEIRQPKYIYTLNGGRLTAFSLRESPRKGTKQKWLPVPDISKDVLSTGHEEIDSSFGGLARGRLMALEIATDVPHDFIDDFRAGLICNFALHGRGVAYVPSKKATAELVKEDIDPYLPEGVFDDHVRVFETSPLGSLEGSKNALHMEGGNIDTDLKWSNVEYHLPKAKHPFLSMVSFDTLEAIYGPSVLEQMSGHLSAVRRNRDVFIGIATPINVSCAKLASLAHAHLRVENINGSIVMSSEKPFSELFDVSFDYSKGHPKARLVPIR